MIDKMFIEQSKQLRREFIKNAKEIIKHDDKINFYKNELNIIQEEMHGKMNEQDLLEKLILIEKNIKAIEKIIEPYNVKKKQLEKDADRLFDNIKERHSTLTTSMIQNELIPHLLEIKF